MPSAPHLRWSRTWPNRPRDFTGRDARFPWLYVRVRSLTTRGPDEQPWHWGLCKADGMTNLGAGSNTKTEALEAALEAYVKYLQELGVEP